MVKPPGGGKTAIISGIKGEEISIKDPEIFEKSGIPGDIEDYCYMSKKQFGDWLRKKGLKFTQKGPVNLDEEEVVSSKKIADEALIDCKNKKIYVIENKRQERAGSVSEKLETGQFKFDYWSKIARSLGMELRGFYFTVTGEYFTDGVRNRLSDLIEYYETLDVDIVIIFVDYVD